MNTCGNCRHWEQLVLMRTPLAGVCKNPLHRIEDVEELKGSMVCLNTDCPFGQRKDLGA